MKYLRIYLLIFTLVQGSIIHAQDAYVDSLRTVLRDLGLDTARVNTWNTEGHVVR